MSQLAHLSSLRFTHSLHGRRVSQSALSPCESTLITACTLALDVSSTAPSGCRRQELQGCAPGVVQDEDQRVQVRRGQLLCAVSFLVIAPHSCLLLHFEPLGSHDLTRERICSRSNARPIDPSDGITYHALVLPCSSCVPTSLQSCSRASATDQPTDDFA